MSENIETEVEKESNNSVIESLPESNSVVKQEPHENVKVPEKPVPDYGKVIAGVKKEFRQKGYNEGFEAAQAAKNSSIESETTETKDTPTFDKSQIINELRNQQWIERAQNTDAQGQQKFSDYAEKIEEAANRANYDPSFKLLMQKAYETGDPSIVYKMTADTKARQEMLDTPPTQWASKFYQSNDEPMITLKNPAPPIEPLKSTPAIGTKNLTFEQKRQIARDNY